MHKTGYVLYIDNFGKDHDALVRALNPQHPSFVDLSYVDDKVDERDNLVTIYGVPHMTNESQQDSNPGLPTYHVHCWKERDEEHNALPADHPAFDNPFKQPEKDQDGNIIPVPRPEFEKEIADHLASKAPSEADLDKDAEEKAAKEKTAAKPRIIKGSQAK